MRIQVYTVAFRGSGAINCTACHKKVYFPDDTSAVLRNDGKRIKVLSAVDGTVIHLCGRRLEWRCPECDTVGEPQVMRRYVGRSRRRTLDTRCQCGGSFVQRELSE